MEKILSRHWHILREDPHLKTTVSDCPLVTYRRARNIKAKIAPSKTKTSRPIRSIPLTFFGIKGMYQCKKPLCLTCAHVTHRQKYLFRKGYVVYFLTCPCSLFYVGRTIRTLRKRFGEHRNLVEQGKDKRSVPRHFLQFHKQSSDGLRVWILEAISKTLPTAECFKRLCKKRKSLDIFP